MSVKPPRGRRNDRKPRGDRLSTGSVNLRTDTVQAAFLCKAEQGSLSRPCRFTKRKLYSSQAGHPSAGRRWNLTFRAWTPLLAAAGFSQLWVNIWGDSQCECELLSDDAEASRRLNEWSKPRLLILKGTQGIQYSPLFLCVQRSERFAGKDVKKED